ncbi:hypothetical protein B0H66DRAFT_637794 [Apodospora peruviana]|uniref:Uncharacterized protein n=1 Tax=Apodospora peruviana TaxID=516989 RepID=A0AAE0MBX1_9PEZI|nr:hypothetical protein B0H66DRAFT_637794 [Apodospora peruviana]
MVARPLLFCFLSFSSHSSRQLAVSRQSILFQPLILPTSVTVANWGPHRRRRRRRRRRRAPICVGLRCGGPKLDQLVPTAARQCCRQIKEHGLLDGLLARMAFYLHCTTVLRRLLDQESKTRKRAYLLNPLHDTLAFLQASLASNSR